MLIFDLITVGVIINLSILIWIVLGYYAYNKYLITPTELEEPTLTEHIQQLSEDMAESMSEALSQVEIDPKAINLEGIADKLTEQFFGTFLAILGVTEETDENWNFRTYIKEIIDSSVETIVPETIKQFEGILPEFADSFIEGLQKALMESMPEGIEGAPTKALTTQVSQSMQDLDVGKIIQLYVLQLVMSKMGDLGSLTGGLGALTSSSAPNISPRSGF